MGQSVALILRDGNYPDLKMDVIGVDAGAAYALSHHLKMVCALGDFDSIDSRTLDLIKQQTTVIQFPRKKDQSDSQIAVEKALELGYDDILIYGALGGRYDHHHVNMVLAYLHDEITLLDQDHWIKSFGPGVYGIKKESHEKLSLFTFETCVVSLSQVEYPLDHQTMTLQSLFGLSNTFISDEAILTIHAGRALVICGKT